MRHINYLKYVLRHKWFVFLACLNPVLHVPIWRAVFHDLSKFTPAEWFPYARCFYTPTGEKYYDDGILAPGWMHHQHVNDHHWQYWLKFGVVRIQDTNILVMDSGGAYMLIEADELGGGGLFPYTTTPAVPTPMPDVAIREMIADWIGAGRSTGSKLTVQQWYAKNSVKIKLHPNTRIVLETYLGKL